jgi:hypothetical protein
MGFHLLSLTLRIHYIKKYLHLQMKMIPEKLMDAKVKSKTIMKKTTRKVELKATCNSQSLKKKIV